MTNDDWSPSWLEGLNEVADEPLGDEWFFVGEETALNLGPPYRCPKPTPWRMTDQAVKATGSWALVSSAIFAKNGPVHHTFQVQRSITWGASVTETLKGSLKLIELELGITLDTHTTVSTGETVDYTVPKGRTMALFAAPGYVVRSFARVAYGGAMCNVVRQTARVRSPYAHFLKPDFV